MKSKFLIVSLALCLVLGTFAQAYDCGCNDVNPCNACNACCTQKCDLFSGLKKLFNTQPCSLSSCGPCDAVVACAPCEVACVQACDPVVNCVAPIAPCEPMVYAAACGDTFGCDVGCYDNGCFAPCNDRPLLNAAKKTKANVSRFFNGLFGSMKGCDCGICRGHGCNACDPCAVACDPCGPAANCYGNYGYGNSMPTAVPE